MGRRSRRRDREGGAAAPETTDYEDANGNVLTLRDRLSEGTLRQLADLPRSAAASADDAWQRRLEFLFERFVVAWSVAGLPIEGQKELVQRYRIADEETRRWVRQTLDEHLRKAHPEAAG